MKRPVIAVGFTLLLVLGLIWAGNIGLRATRASLAPPLQEEGGGEVVKGEMEGVEFQSRDEPSGVFTRISAKKLSLSEGRAFLFFRSALKPELMLMDPHVTLSGSGKAKGVFTAAGRLGLYDPLTNATRLSGGVRGDADGVVFVAVELSLAADGLLTIEGDYTVEGPKGKLYRGKALKMDALKVGATLRDMITKNYLKEAKVPAVVPAAAALPQETINNP